MALKIFSKKIHDLDAIFNGHYIDARAFYAWQFRRLPSIHFLGEIDVTEACKHIQEMYKRCIVELYQHSWFERKEDSFFFNNSIIVLRDHRMIELAADYCQLLFMPKQGEWAAQVAKEIAAFRKVAAETKEVRVMGFARQAEVN